MQSRQRLHGEVHHEVNEDAVQRAGDDRLRGEESNPAAGEVEQRRPDQGDEEVEGGAERRGSGAAFERCLAQGARGDALQHARHAAVVVQRDQNGRGEIEDPRDEPADQDCHVRMVCADRCTFLQLSCDKTPRAMKVHEYQAKEILRRYGVPTPRGVVAETPDEARAAAKELGGRVVVKAQIHAGGRGKGGGVKLAKDADEAAELTKKMIGMTLVTHQTGPEGRVVRKVLIEEALNIDRELYLGITLDRRIGMPVVMASKQGGMEIEEVAARDPKAIHREPIDSVLGVVPFQARSVANALDLEGDSHKKCVDFLTKLMRAYIDKI